MRGIFLQCTQDAIFNLLVILFYIPQSKSSQVYRKTFYRANDFHFGLSCPVPSWLDFAWPGPATSSCCLNKL